MRLYKHFSWLKSLCTPINTVYTSFLTYRTNTLYECYLTGQTIQLQRLLNDRYDDALRRIIIIHSLNFDITLYLDSEAQPSEDKVLYTDAEATPANDIDLYLDSESGGSLGVDFRVLVPTAYSAFEIEMTNLIRKYALVDKTFDIQFV